VSSYRRTGFRTLLAPYSASTRALSTELKQPSRDSDCSSESSVIVRIHVVLPPFLLGKLVVAQLVVESPLSVSIEWEAFLLCMRNVQDSYPAWRPSLLRPFWLSSVTAVIQIRLRPLARVFQSDNH
jgi:hypothetical protein